MSTPTRLFAELFASLDLQAWPVAGIIVPTGIATDATTAPFFRGPGSQASGWRCNVASLVLVGRWFLPLRSDQ